MFTLKHSITLSSKTSTQNTLRCSKHLKNATEQFVTICCVNTLQYRICFINLFIGF